VAVNTADEVRRMVPAGGMLRNADASAAKPSPVLDAAEVRAVLLAEIDRLREVVKGAEWSAGVDAYSCPWCDADRDLMRFGNGRPVEGTGTHHEICPAFWPDGRVR
jgi:hypothetical protein